MTGKTKKDLESENTLLKQEIDNLKNKLVEISEKYENLQTKGKPTTFVKRNKILRCEQFFESLTDLKDHKEHRVNSDTFMCDQCDKEFDKEWKLCIHLKKHKKYSCDQCSETFSYINAKNKHIQITHGNLFSIFCNKLIFSPNINC